MKEPIHQSAIVAFRLAEAILPAQRELYRLFDGDLTMMLVLGELAQYSARKRFKLLHSPEPLPFQICNAHSIALASGVPRETVRRKLDKLISRGWIIQQANGELYLNEKADPPLHSYFREYNRQLLANMRSAIRDLEGIDLQDEA